MLGVEAAVIGVTCLVVIVLLLTSPWWMRGLTALASALWRQLSRTDDDVVARDASKNIVEGEYREVEK